MKRVGIALVLLLLSISLIYFYFHSPTPSIDRLRLATTTSTDNSGLLAALLPPFEKANGCRVDVVAVGTGKAIKLGENGDVDVILVHDRSREDAFVSDGYGVDRRDVMYNDFVILGPPTDPAGIRGMNNAVAAMKKLAAAKEIFVSRGDDSGTDTREKQLWSAAGLSPAGDWYLETGRGMGDVLVMANERQGYTLADRGTYLAFRGKVSLDIVVAGDPRLFNPYGVILVNPQKHPHINASLGRKLIQYLTSGEARDIITGFRSGGEQLFHVTE